MADIPGLIEGASVGRGLGHEFLRHVERTRVLLCMVPADDPDPPLQARMILNELVAYNPVLASKPRISVLTKVDVLEPGSPAADWDEGPPHRLSAHTGEGLAELQEKIWILLQDVPPGEPTDGRAQDALPA
jgi:GTPase